MMSGLEKETVGDPHRYDLIISPQMSSRQWLVVLGARMDGEKLLPGEGPVVRDGVRQTLGPDCSRDWERILLMLGRYGMGPGDGNQCTLC